MSNNPNVNVQKLHAVLRCVTKPSDEQKTKFIEFLAAKYSVRKEDVELEVVLEPKVHGGFILDVGSDEYDAVARDSSKTVLTPQGKKLTEMTVRATAPAAS